MSRSQERRLGIQKAEALKRVMENHDEALEALIDTDVWDGLEEIVGCNLHSVTVKDQRSSESEGFTILYEARKASSEEIVRVIDHFIPHKSRMTFIAQQEHIDAFFGEEDGAETIPGEGSQGPDQGQVQPEESDTELADGQREDDHPGPVPPGIQGL
ncbi:MAG: hypothetical protein ACXABY_22060 [Candidatus Thorarchaeota archaeon]|jgi:hypothetical protein